jgi:hypothetical protein
MWLLGNLVVGVGTADAQVVSLAPEVRLIAGGVKTYLDEPIQPTIGAGFRIPLTSRLSVEPEVLRLRGERFVNWHILGNVTFSLAKGTRVAPYFVGGIGVDRERDKAINYDSSGLMFSGGLGVRIALTDRVSLSPEGRLGLGNFPRLTVALGVALR